MMDYHNLNNIILNVSNTKEPCEREKLLKEWVMSNLHEINLVGYIESYDDRLNLFTVYIGGIKRHLKLNKLADNSNLLKDIYILKLLSGTVAPKIIDYGYFINADGIQITIIFEYTYISSDFTIFPRIFDMSKRVKDVIEILTDFGIIVKKCEPIGIGLDIKGNFWIFDLRHAFLVNELYITPQTINN